MEFKGKLVLKTGYNHSPSNANCSEGGRKPPQVWLDVKKQMQEELQWLEKYFERRFEYNNKLKSYADKLSKIKFEGIED